MRVQKRVVFPSAIERNEFCDENLSYFRTSSVMLCYVTCLNMCEADNRLFDEFWIPKYRDMYVRIVSITKHYF